MKFFLILIFSSITGIAAAQSLEHLHLANVGVGSGNISNASPHGIVAADGGYSYKWDDVKKFWTRLNDPYRGDSLTVTAAMIDPSGIIYDHLSNGWNTRSDDGGLTFLLLPASELSWSGQVLNSVISPAEELFFPVPYFIRSIDKVQTWDTLLRPPNSGGTMCFDKAGDVIFLGSSVWRLTKGDTTMDSISNFGRGLGECSCSPSSKGMLVGSHDSVYFSSDAGEHWTIFPPVLNLANNGLTFVCCDSSSKIYGITSKDYFVRSDDTGRSWILLDSSHNDPSRPPFSKVFCQGPATIWCVAQNSTYQYSQGTFIDCDSGFESLAVWALAAKQDTLFAAEESTDCFYRSTDEGSTWSKSLSDSVITSKSSSITFSSDGATYLWAPRSASQSLYKTYDGIKWSNISPPNANIGNYLGSIIIDSTSGIYVRSADFSSDDGASWQNRTLVYPLLGVNTRGDLCSATDSSFHYSRDRGQSWNTVFIGDTFARAGQWTPTFYSSHGVMWLSYDSVLLRSTDNGLTWSRAMKGLSRSPYSLINTDPHGHTFCIQGSIWYSNVLGTCAIYNWDDVTEGWHRLTADTTLVPWVLCSNDDYLFIGSAGSFGGGMFRIPISSFDLDVKTKDETPANDIQTAIFPNPSSGNFSIQAHLRERSDVIVTLYNTLGCIVCVFDGGFRDPGLNVISMKEELPSGIYTYEVSVGKQIARGQIVISR
ncbi:MAG TPA: T9SS type A sorting domain-containing protein [Candidatus Kapabacteria bacterium]|jgi:photosystem II stability/assembly factor-like uncharacterized protein|nr:T9SS type A sorting domain-containing protein [Candidatus Kapabacteria bacterium]